MSKFTLDWKDYPKNLAEYFRQEKDFVDVTLSCGNNHQIKAHKVILSSGSIFFKDVLSKALHPEPFIFLDGVSRSNLKNIIEFIYTGETSIEESDIDTFFKTASRLQINGIDIDSYKAIIEELEDTSEPGDVRTIDSEHMNPLKIETFEKEAKGLENLGESASSDDFNEDIIDTYQTIEDNVDSITKLEEILRNVDNVWECIVCGKTDHRRCRVQKHAEIHLQGVSHSCSFCDKKAKTTTALRKHINYEHSAKIYFCDICGKKDMTLVQSKDHMRSHKSDFSCKICEKSGLTWVQRKKHMQYHKT